MLNIHYITAKFFIKFVSLVSCSAQDPEHVSDQIDEYFVALGYQDPLNT